jgi:hypothetical protein
MNQDNFLRMLALAALLTAGVAQAKVSQEQANKLGTVLTPMGAIKEGNGAGTIPPYAGTMLGAPKWVNYKGTGHAFPDPYPDEEPLFTITSQNFRQYKANLTDGQIALFEKYKDFQMPIYTSHRDARYSDFVHENTKYNAVNTVLVAEGNGFHNGFMGTPFPIPQNGVELIWNHQASPNYEATNGELDSVSVFSDGTESWQSNLEERWIMLFAPTLGREAYNNQPYNAKVMVQTTAPARQKGEVILVHEYRDVSVQSRDAWQYLPGTRRVRRAPTIAYDFPNGPGGLRTVDDALLFNGATDRYTWKMEPSRELYIPYNNNRLDDQKVSYDQILGANTLNPKYMRYELHRCWVVVGELRSDKRHIYGKRRLYLDEDSWAGVLADNYDGQGVLWRTNLRAMVNLYDLPGMGPRVELYHDLQKGAYAANYLLNEKSGPPVIPKQLLPDSYFTTAQVRKLGKR